MSGVDGARLFMPAEDEDIWPDWGKPATKGDVVLALLGVRGSLLKMGTLLTAIKLGDDVKFIDNMKSMLNDLSEMEKLSEKIGGRKS